MKSFIANITLLSVILIWALGVDAAPVLKALGLPMLIGAVMLWVRWSNIAKRLIEGDRYE
jgi:hypothetical protein